jgi:hypothetical protein
MLLNRQSLLFALGVLSLALLVVLVQAARHFSLDAADGWLPGAALHPAPPVAAAALQPPDTLWAPRCQLPEDRAPGHGAKALVDISVICEFGARARRDAIRAGYGRYARELGMRVRFFVGEGVDERGAASRAAEALAFKDLVVLRMRDTYENLTIKSLGTACVWHQQCWNRRRHRRLDSRVTRPPYSSNPTNPPHTPSTLQRLRQQVRQWGLLRQSRR